MRRLRNLPAPTLRLYLLACAPAVLLVLGSFDPWFTGAAAGVILALVLVTLTDHSLAASSRMLTVQRLHHPRLYIGADNRIELAIENRSSRDILVRLRDTPPVSFSATSLVTAGVAAAHGATVLAYVVRPRSRGRFSFGGVTLRCLTPLGLLWRQHAYALTEEVDVYHNLLEVEKYDLLVRRDLLRNAGLRVTRNLDRGTEFASLREYQPDDDFRRINWKATARRHRPITNVYETERSKRLLIALDVGRMMAPRVGELTRLDVAVNTALLLAYVALMKGDRVGLLTFADGVQAYTPTRGGRGHFYTIVQQLYDARAQYVEPDYNRAFARMRTDLRGRSMVALFTDTSDQIVAQSIARHLALLARHHLAICVTLSDTELRNTGERLPDSGAQLYQKVVALKLMEEREALLEGMRRNGVLTVDVPADQMALATINRYLEAKERAL